MITFPNISPVILEIGPLAIRWYSLAYIAGVLLGYIYIKKIDKHKILSDKALDDLISYAIFGIIIGGRLGYNMLYNFKYYISHPIDILKTWEGGMSFHGGMAGLLIAVLYLARKYQIKFLAITDLLACAAPIGLFFGRIANFINAELYGRVTDKPWGVVFPGAGPEPRHPSQLYEALLEGVILFSILNLLRRTAFKNAPTGTISILFLLCYATFRIAAETLREPDSNIGFIMGWFTMGQLLSGAMIIAAVFIYKKLLHLSSF